MRTKCAVVLSSPECVALGGLSQRVIAGCSRDGARSHTGCLQLRAADRARVAPKRTPAAHITRNAREKLPGVCGVNNLRWKRPLSAVSHRPDTGRRDMLGRIHRGAAGRAATRFLAPEEGADVRGHRHGALIVDAPSSDVGCALDLDVGEGRLRLSNRKLCQLPAVSSHCPTARPLSLIPVRDVVPSVSPGKSTIVK